MTEANKNIESKIERNNMRHHMQEKKQDDRRGGGLLICYKNNGQINLDKEDSSRDGILILAGNIFKERTIIILVYLQVDNCEESRKSNKNIMEHIEKLMKENTECNVILLGDFNGHIGTIGYQEENHNGKLVNGLIQEHGIILLNLDQKCKGQVTWRRNQQYSTIDFAMTNSNQYEKFSDMVIDEEQELYDLSDHNMMEISFKYVTKSKEERKEQEYFKKDEKSMEIYVQRVKELLQRNPPNRIEQFNEIVIKAADDTLKKVIKRKKGNNIDKPWFNRNIQDGIKKRKYFNRKRRREVDEQERRKWEKLYKEQKKKVQEDIREAKLRYEIEITEDIKNNRNDCKKLWGYINKLKGEKNIQNDQEVYDETGEKLNNNEKTSKLKNFWEGIYQQHENKTKETWNESTRQEYKRKNEGRSMPQEIRDHMDMAFNKAREVNYMEDIEITDKEIREVLSKMKVGKAPGLDKVYTAWYKSLIKEDDCVDILKKCLQNIVTEGRIPKEWKVSRTKLIEKTRKPKVGDFRPIALTNISYKLFMAIVKKKIESHLVNSNSTKETQAGFTEKGRIEDNLFILQHCHERSRERNKPLYILSIDFKKAYDSIKRETIIEALMHYGVNEKIIEAIAGIYENDKTILTMNNLKQEVQITSGIKQGCTGSTTLFKIITYIIIEEMEKYGRGYHDLELSIIALFFADDGLILANSLNDAIRNLRFITHCAARFGLLINKEKSNFLVMNEKNKPLEIEGIKVKNKIKYLGIIICDEADMFKEQEKLIIEKAKRSAQLTYNVIAKACNKVIIGKTYWKSIAMPSFLYGVSVMDIKKGTIDKLQKIEYDVYRKILGAPKFAATASLVGEIGASYMEKRMVEGRLKYIQGILRGRNGLLLKILERGKEEDTKMIRKYKEDLQLLNIGWHDLEIRPWNNIKNRSIQLFDKKWKEEVMSKPSLDMYRLYKKSIKDESIYDNRPESVTWFRARTNCLPLNSRISEEKGCKLCKQGEEDLVHVLLECPELFQERQMIKELQRPFYQNEATVIGDFLYKNDDLDEKKSNLHTLLTKRNSLNLLGSQEDTDA